MNSHTTAPHPFEQGLAFTKYSNMPLSLFHLGMSIEAEQAVSYHTWDTRMIDPKFHIDTDLSIDRLSLMLKAHEPWRMGISFSNGLNTADFKTIQPFSDIPLNKLRMIAEHCGEEWLSGKRVLDIGSNIGYNTIVLTRDFGCDVTGLEFNPENIKKADFIADLCATDAQFTLGDAGTFCQENEFDLILHLGTLYHLPNPIEALRCSAASIKPGGRIYIETTVYNGDDEYACRYIHGHGNDFTNYWALSTRVIIDLLERYKLINAEKIMDFSIKSYEGTGMSRSIFVAEKA